MVQLVFPTEAASRLETVRGFLIQSGLLGAVSLIGWGATSTPITMHDSLSSSLGHYFQRMLGPGRSASPTIHVAQGAECVSAADLAGLRALLPEVKAKAAGIKESERLRQRIELLAQFLEESADTDHSTAHREATFVLYYFIKGNDLIPDSVPEIGLLDDALLVEAAVHRNLHTLSTHWAEKGRIWPDHL